MFKTGVVRANKNEFNASSGGILGIFFRFSSACKYVVCFSLESPHGGDSNEYTQHTNINIKRKSP